MARRGFLNSLSGRFLMLTVAFVMLAEVLIFLPSIARFREDYLLLRLEKAQIASLALLATDGMLSHELEAELLANAGVFNVVLYRDQVRQLILSSPMPEAIVATYDLREAGAFGLIRDAMAVLVTPKSQAMRVIGSPVQAAGSLIEVSLPSGPLRAAMLDYGLRIFLLSALISALTASLLFLAVRRLLVLPIRRVVQSMTDYAQAPEDVTKVIAPSSAVTELRVAEEALAGLQTQLSGALRQRERLAQLGSALAKVSHDLRNILTTAQLFADRIEASTDPGVARTVPKLVSSITRAVNLCEATLAFGKAEEPPPRLRMLALRPLVEDVLEAEALDIREGLACHLDIPGSLSLRADPEQLYRVFANLLRNAAQAIEAADKVGAISVAAQETAHAWEITITDTGPGLPPRAREHLFTAFQGAARKGGTGLGLAIAAELIRGHGGRLELLRTDSAGTAFLIALPKSQRQEGEG